MANLNKHLPARGKKHSHSHSHSHVHPVRKHKHTLVKSVAVLTLISLCVILSHGLEGFTIAVLATKFVEVVTDVVVDRVFPG